MSRETTSLSLEAVVVLCMTFLWFSFNVARSQPRVSIPKPTLTLDTVYQGQPLAALIPIRNSGQDNLLIRSVSPSCDCTTIRHAPTAIAPNHLDTIRVTINTSGLRGTEEKQVFVQTNDRSTPIAAIRLRFTVVTEVEPADGEYNLWLGSVPVGTTLRKSVSFRNVSGVPLAICGVSTASPELVFTFQPRIIQPGQKGDADFSLTPSHEGVSRSEVVFSFSGGHQRVMALTVTCVGSRPR